VYAVLQDLFPDEKGYQKEWNGFWRFWNVMQFLPDFSGMTEKGLLNDSYKHLPRRKNEDDIQLGPWADILEMTFDDAAKVFIQELIELKVSTEGLVQSYELAGDKDEVLAEAELAWPEQKLVYCTEDQNEGREVFINAGWTVVTTAQELAEKLNGGKA